MRILILALTFILAISSHGRAADDLTGAQTVIRAQLDAMDRDDAAAAYSFAAPAIKGLFPEADSFMTMVRRNYAAVHRHKSFTFGEGRAVGGQFIQEVKLVDAEGVPWRAIYTLEQQADGSLKITGCTLQAIGTPA